MDLPPIRRVDGYLPIEDHGLLGDGTSAALVDLVRRYYPQAFSHIGLVSSGMNLARCLAGGRRR